jgi:hypothetical protein
MSLTKGGLSLGRLQIKFNSTLISLRIALKMIVKEI